MLALPVSSKLQVSLSLYLYYILGKRFLT